MGRGIPDRWAAYTAFGSIIRGTRFLPFKVPLKEALCKDLPAEQKFTPGILVETLREQQQQPMQLGLVIDLTNTKRYYNPQEITKHNIRYEKIFTEGHEVPGAAVQRRFTEIVDRFLRENSCNGLLIGVHCTHGVNRTGYLVCRYMIDRMQALPSAAIQAFNDGRGHVIERENYLQHLSSVSTAVASKREFESAAGSIVADAATLSASRSLPNFSTHQPCSGSYEPGQCGRADASQQQPRRWKQKQAKREAKKLSRQSAAQGQELCVPQADRASSQGLLMPASRLTGADSATWPRAVGFDDQRGAEGRYWSSQACQSHGSRKEWACRRREASAPSEASSEWTARSSDDDPAAGAGTVMWGRLPDTRPVGRTGRPYDVHDARMHRRAFSDSRLFGPALLPHPATDRADGWQPWQQLPSRARSWQEDCRSSDSRRWSPHRPTLQGYCPVMLPQHDGSAYAERTDPKQCWSKNSTARR